MQRLTPQQIEVVVGQIKNYGTIALAAQYAGVPPSVFKRMMDSDAELKDEVENAMALFQDSIRLQVLDRSRTSDMLLKLAAESFVPETFKQTPITAKVTGRPTGLTLRTFSTEADDVVEKQQPEKKPTLLLETNVWL